MAVTFVVQQAGCESCAGRVREALAPVGVVDEIAIDEAADLGHVRMTPHGAVSEEAVGRLLRDASAGSGHEYRVRPGSWQADA